MARKEEWESAISAAIERGDTSPPEIYRSYVDIIIRAIGDVVWLHKEKLESVLDRDEPDDLIYDTRRYRQIPLNELKIKYAALTEMYNAAYEPSNISKLLLVYYALGQYIKFRENGDSTEQRIQAVFERDFNLIKRADNAWRLNTYTEEIEPAIKTSVRKRLQVQRPINGRSIAATERAHDRVVSKDGLYCTMVTCNPRRTELIETGTTQLPYYNPQRYVTPTTLTITEFDEFVRIEDRRIIDAVNTLIYRDIVKRAVEIDYQRNRFVKPWFTPFTALIRQIKGTSHTDSKKKIATAKEIQEVAEAFKLLSRFWIKLNAYDEIYARGYRDIAYTWNQYGEHEEPLFLGSIDTQPVNGTMVKGFSLDVVPIQFRYAHDIGKLYIIDDDTYPRPLNGQHFTSDWDKIAYYVWNRIDNMYRDRREQQSKFKIMLDKVSESVKYNVDTPKRKRRFRELMEQILDVLETETDLTLNHRQFIAGRHVVKEGRKTSGFFIELLPKRPSTHFENIEQDKVYIKARNKK